MCDLSQKEHFVYCLILNKKTIYIGCCVDTKRRESAHRINKKFDYLFILSKYPNKKEALIAENSIIRFLSIINDPDVVNALNCPLRSKKELNDYHFYKDEWERRVDNG